MKLPVFQIDAFATAVFGGNPAVVCCLEEWPDDAVLKAIAVEHNISTTAFLIDRGADIEIRYFAPFGELPLVGHASLAAAYIVLSRLSPEADSVTLRRRTGTLAVSREPGGRFAITLPVVAAPLAPVPDGLASALGIGAIDEVRANASQYFVVLNDEAEIARLAPDMDKLMRIDRDGIVVSAPSRRADFVSRVFAPKEGLPEDPVWGSAHLSLVPYWSERLGKTAHHALQLSERGGELFCTLHGDAVRLAGACALYSEGSIHLDGMAAKAAEFPRAV
jgi:PhzF family phenazine biosynthesis protein